MGWEIWFPAPGEVTLRHGPDPEPGPGEVAVEATASLISTGTECTVLQQRYAPDTHWARWGRFPFAPGYSLVGRVRAIGPGVQGLAPGDRVAVRAPHRQVALVQRVVAAVPPDIPDVQACWFALGTITQNGVRRAQIELGDTVAVVGLGILGQLVCQYAWTAGARRVIAIDPEAQRLRVAERLGATHPLPLPVSEAADAVRRITGGRMADVVFDVTGAAAAFAPALGLVRRLGRFVLLGDTGYPEQQHLTPEVITRGIQIIGTHDSHPPAVASEHAFWSHTQMAELFFELLRQGRLRVAEIPSQVLSPRQAPRIYQELCARPGAYLGIVLDWQHPDLATAWEGAPQGGV